MLLKYQTIIWIIVLLQLSELQDSRFAAWQSTTTFFMQLLPMKSLSLIYQTTCIDTFTTNCPTSGSIKSIVFHSTRMFTAHQDCRIRVWRILHSSAEEHRLLYSLPTVKDRLCHFLLPKNYVSVRRHEKRLWIEHWDTVSGLAVHGGVMYSVSWDKSFKMWDIDNSRCVESVLAHQDAINTIAVSDNGTVYTGAADGSIKVWKKVSNERKHRLAATLERHKSAINALVLNGDGSMLFSGGGDCSIMVWQRTEMDADDHENEGNHMAFLEELMGHRRAIMCLMNVGQLIVSGSSDRTVRIWQQFGEKSGYYCVAAMEGHESPVKSLAAVNSSESNDGLLLLICSGSLDGEIKVWEISTQASS